MTEDVLVKKLNILCQAASKVVADVFNCTPGAFRPVAMAALRLNVESAVATMSENERAIYAQAMGHLEMTAVKIPRKP